MVNPAGPAGPAEPAGPAGPAGVRRRVVVWGRVQGVFFRDSLRKMANAAGVAGWVRNRSDGAVEAVLEGDPSAVDRLVAWCRSGPPGAVVTGVRLTEEEPEGLRRFRVG